MKVNSGAIRVPIWCISILQLKIYNFYFNDLSKGPETILKIRRIVSEAWEGVHSRLILTVHLLFNLPQLSPQPCE